MVNLMLRSFMVLALLFGLLFAVGMAVLTYFDMPTIYAVLFALGILFLQYLIGPFILQLIYKIQWRDLADVDPELARFVERACADRRIPRPRFGLIQDGNPNAFTFGHYPGNARLVVTTGLLDLLSPEERQAVVAHELGHIAHWDFVVMTVAAAVPLLLFILYRSTLRSRGGRRGKDSGYAALVGLVSYVAYIISHYIVLLLSRVREYYADRFAGQTAGDPDALATALVKVAYGLAAAPQDKKRDDTRMTAARAFGIFDPRVAQTLALTSAGSQGVTMESMETAMKWDLWNPWGSIYELSSTHPLPAKRIRALERQSMAQGRPSRYSFRAVQPESYWDEFAVDLLINYLPALGALLGLALTVFAFAFLNLGLGALGLFFITLSVAWWLKRRFSYRHAFDERRTIKSLVAEVKVSAVRSIPCTIQGTIIGRGVPGLFYSEDLVMQDETGFMVLDYRQPLRIVEFLFGWTKAEKLIKRTGEAVGWYRRSPRPYFEMRRLKLDNGEVVTSYLYPVTQFFVYATFALGAILLAAGALGVI